MRREFLLASIVSGLAETLTRKVRRSKGNDEFKEWRVLKRVTGDEIAVFVGSA